MGHPSPIGTKLDRHQLRRIQGLPTISILVGPPTLGLPHWRSWASSAGRAAIVSGDLEAAVLQWFARIDSPKNRAIDWLSAMIFRDETESFDLSKLAPYDLNLLWTEIPNAKSDPGANVAFLVLNAAVRGESIHGAAMLKELGAAVLFAGLCALIPVATWPAILLLDDSSGNDSESHFTNSLRSIEPLARLVPGLPLGICVSNSVFEKATAETTRLMALAREGEVRLSPLTAMQLIEKMKLAGVPEPLPDVAIDRLAARGVSEQTADSFVRAELEQRSPPTEDDPHRSASEKFLFELLESLPETAGMFEANRNLEFLHGHKLAEADLVSPELKLVLEIDGGYFHLNPVAYRRDRRKDWSYQRHGYWVLRFLAEDVVADFEAILKTIVEAVGLRRTPPEVPPVD